MRTLGNLWRLLPAHWLHGSRRAACCGNDGEAKHWQTCHVAVQTNSHVGDAGIQPLLRPLQQAAKAVQQAAIRSCTAGLAG